MLMLNISAGQMVNQENDSKEELSWHLNRLL